MERQALELLERVKEVSWDPKDLPKSDEILTEIEGLHIELDAAYPWPSYLSELLQAANFLAIRSSNSSDDPFAFAARSFCLKKKWERLQIIAMGNAWSSRLPPIHGQRSSIPLPAEMIAAIISNHVTDTHQSPRQRSREQTDLLLALSLVSKSWNSVATNMLYRECIRLYTPSSIQNLHRTLSQDVPCPRLILNLILGYRCWLPPPSPPWPVRLLGLCASLEVLEINAVDLDYSEGSFPQDFQHLRELRLGSVTLRLLAPLIAKCPNLSVLRIDGFRNSSGRPRAFRSGGPPPGDSLSDIPTPAYNLRELYLTDGLLTEEQTMWLLQTSKTLETVALGGVYAPALAEIIHSSVKSLRLEDRSYKDALAKGVAIYTSLEYLQVTGRDWPWGILFSNTGQSLRKINISWSPSGFGALASALEQTSWQAHINCITAFQGPADMYADDALDDAELIPVNDVDLHPAFCRLKAVCEARKISFEWSTAPIDTFRSDMQEE